MDFIFEHEKLRVAEIMRKVNEKNNFSPLKPLRNSKLGIRKNTLDRAVRKKYKGIGKNNFYKEGKSISPYVSKLFSDFPLALKNEIRTIEKKDNKHLGHSKIEVVKFSEKESEKNETVLPVIGRPAHVLSFKQQNDSLRKLSKSVIAYIPAVSYMDDKEENIDLKYPSKNIKFN